jgi:ADP-ribose pyrophosphatase
MREEKTIDSKQIYEGKIINFRVDTVSVPSGEIKIRELVEHPGAVAIVALMHDNENEKVLLVEQYRKALERTTLEIPVGLLRRGESPEQCARRRLIEETGFQAGRLEKLVEYYPSPGFSNEIIHIFKATELKKVSEGELSGKFVKMNELLTKIKNGEIKDGKIIISVLILVLAQSYL